MPWSVYKIAGQNKNPVSLWSFSPGRFFGNLFFPGLCIDYRPADKIPVVFPDQLWRIDVYSCFSAQTPISQRLLRDVVLCEDIGLRYRISITHQFLPLPGFVWSYCSRSFSAAMAAVVVKILSCPSAPAIPISFLISRIARFAKC